MLRLKDIKKDYRVGGQDVPALKGINLSFRKNEFVSILGPSGCGKTTTLNIIGGLDHYTSGDLFIAGRSTKDFKNKDWDVYRNHRIGFIFQSYNLIPHQTILGNVELALTIAGLSKEERTARAKKAIDRVGLAGSYNKKPNQLSGGQCQRVAIARALVNEPEILLADEPTGALDTQTSVQIMDLIKDISKDKLVIMVTHNPDLATQYSTRIIKLLDGQVQSDSNPFSEEDEIAESKAHIEANQANKEVTPEKAKMKFSTAFKLSFRNLLSKKKRTVLTVVAGSIGIVGVASVLSVSQGVKDYIASMQDDMLSGNPITIAEQAIDYNALMNGASLSDKAEIIKNGGMVNVDSLVEYLLKHQDVLMSILVNNKINKDYIDYVKSMPEDFYSAIELDYGLNVSRSIYTDFKAYKNVDTKYDRTLSVDAITNTYRGLIEQFPDYEMYSQIIINLVKSFTQGVADNDYIKTQYDILDGNLPQNPNDVLVVLGDDEELTDLLLAQLGYYTQDEFLNIVHKGLNDGLYNQSLDKRHFSYEEIRNKKFTWYPNDTIFNKKEINIPSYIESSFEYKYAVDDTFTNGVELNICGIVKPKEGISYGALSSGLIYTEDFARTVIKDNINSEIVKYANENGGSIITSVINDNDPTTPLVKGIAYLLNFNFDKDANADTENQELYTPVLVGDSTNSVLSMMGLSNNMLSNMDKDTLDGIEDVFDFNQVELTTRSLGGKELPSMIKVYPKDFDLKNSVTDYLDKWNSDEEVSFYRFDDNYNQTDEVITLAAGTGSRQYDIKYTDTVGLMIDMINMMINMITIALVCFSSLSLVVSAVMIGIITYVSVVERTKEIGVIRSLGGRKQDVSNLFNAETLMIGLASGVFGIVVTALITIILNLITTYVANIGNIAHLTVINILIMIGISTLLTVFSGFFPARSAAKKDPVEALRSE